MASAATAGKSKRVITEHLSKVWRIDFETAKRTINIINQNRIYTENPNLTRNYSTNDRILRYKKINNYFFMDIFHTISHSGKSSRDYTYIQLFVTDKRFVYIISIK